MQEIATPNRLEKAITVEPLTEKRPCVVPWGVGLRSVSHVKVAGILSSPQTHYLYDNKTFTRGILVSPNPLQ